MLTNAYSLFDTKSLVYYTPWFAPTQGAAVRILSDLVNDPQTSVGRHPSDYVLYRIGTYDDAKGAFAPISPLEHVMDAIALVQRPADLYGQNIYNVATTLNGKEAL